MMNGLLDLIWNVEKPDMDKLAVPHFDHLPIWANGNAYLMGAKAWKKKQISL